MDFNDGYTMCSNSNKTLYFIDNINVLHSLMLSKQDINDDVTLINLVYHSVKTIEIKDFKNRMMISEITFEQYKEVLNMYSMQFALEDYALTEYQQRVIDFLRVVLRKLLFKHGPLQAVNAI